MAGPARRLLLSIHDVTPAVLPQIDRLHAHLTRHGETSGLALLVVPDHWAGAPIANDAGFKRWLRDRHAAGDEVILHGWSHRDEAPAASAIDRFKATRLTAGEGEFLSLDAAEALRRMRDGRALLEEMIGARIRGFIAPAWLYGPGAHAALAEAGFDYAEDHFRVWRPSGGAILARGPVISWASRSRARIASSLAFAALARVTLAASPVVRVAVHPGDTGELMIMDSIRATVRRLRRTHVPGHYGDLLPARRGAAADPARA